MINNLISTNYFSPILCSHFFRVLCPVLSRFYVLFPGSMLNHRPVKTTIHDQQRLQDLRLVVGWNDLGPYGETACRFFFCYRVLIATCSISLYQKNIQNIFYQRYILPLIDYGCNTWSATTSSNIERISKLQKRAARIILQAEYLTPSSLVFDNWDGYLYLGD